MWKHKKLFIDDIIMEILNMFRGNNLGYWGYTHINNT